MNLLTKMETGTLYISGQGITRPWRIINSLIFKNAESMCLTSIAKEKLHMDSYYLLTAINFDQSKWTEVIKYGNEYLRLNKQVKTRPEDFGTIVANSYDSVWKIQILMGIALNETDNAAQSDEMFRTALLNTSSPFNARKTIGTYYFNKGIFDRAQEHLKGASDLNKDDQTVNGLLESIKIRSSISSCRHRYK